MPIESFVLPTPWWCFWKKPLRLTDEMPMHHDWSPVKVGSIDGRHVREAWFNFDLYAHACQSRHTGEWAISLDLGEPSKARFPTRDWAMRAAEHARRENPEIVDPLGVRDRFMKLRDARDALVASTERLKRRTE